MKSFATGTGYGDVRKGGGCLAKSFCNGSLSLQWKVQGAGLSGGGTRRVATIVDTGGGRTSTDSKGRSVFERGRVPSVPNFQN